MSDEPVRRRPIGEVLPGIEIPDLPAGWVPLETVVLVKGLDEDGDALWCTRFTKDLTTVEAIGVLTGVLDLQRRLFMSFYTSDDVDEGDG